jgi:hypothetical protein
MLKIIIVGNVFSVLVQIKAKEEKKAKIYNHQI